MGSTGRELEAFLFERGVQLDLGRATQADSPDSRFGKAFDALLTRGFSDAEWRKGIRYFKGSIFNASGIFKNLKPIYYANPLISRFKLW
jgi:hypothetical protein